nr:PadR regulatory protein [Actinoallomurus sp.]
MFVLGILAKGGPMHGHQIRRTAQIDRMDLWSAVKPGSLYGALHRMVSEGVIEVVRTEQEGNFPARTVYGITETGRAELNAQRDEALRTVRMLPDPVDLALQHTYDLPEEQLRAAIEERKAALETTLSSWTQLREVAGPHIHGLERMTFRHTELRILAELAWHEELLAHLSKLLSEEDDDRTASG